VVEYTATAEITVYRMPTGLSAAVSFTGRRRPRPTLRST
jgi:hypothetical protein